MAWRDSGRSAQAQGAQVMKAEGFEMVCVAERVEGVRSLHDLAHIPPCTSATHADAANHCSSVGHRCTAHAESLRHNCWLWLLLRGKQWLQPVLQRRLVTVPVDGVPALTRERARV